MKKITSVILFVVATISMFAQSDKVNSLIDEGVALFDQGKYQDAMAKYKSAYAIDSNSARLFSEMAMTYATMDDCKNAEGLCKRGIARFGNDNALSTIYVTYGNCLDKEGASSESIKVYEEGISKFPTSDMLYFNKGITELGQKKYYAGKASLEKSIELNPGHASSYYYLGAVEDAFGNRIASVLCFARFMTLSPKGERAQKILPFLTNKVNTLYYLEKHGNSTATMSSSKGRADSTADEFAEVEKGLVLITTLSAALPEKHNEKETTLQKFDTTMQTIIQLVGADKKNHTGFYWNTMAPYFIDMDAKKQVTGFTYYINSFENTDEADSKEVKKNEQKIKDFIDWDKNFK